jgi:hypothetical protein
MTTEGPEQGALFQIEGPDKDGCVWVCSPSGRDVWCQNLGPKDKVAKVLCRWLGSIDYGEREDAHLFAPEMEPGEAEKRDAKRARKLARPKDHREEGGQG